jgi:hypothetical protein
MKNPKASCGARNNFREILDILNILAVDWESFDVGVSSADFGM